MPHSISTVRACPAATESCDLSSYMPTDLTIPVSWAVVTPFVSCPVSIVAAAVVMPCSWATYPTLPEMTV